MLRIAFVSQPFTTLLPPVRNADSISIWTYEVARHLASRAEPLVFCKRAPGQTAHESADGIEFLRLASLDARRLDGVLNRVLARTPYAGRVRVPQRHRFWTYALAAAVAAKRQRADVVHIHNFSEFVPLFRTLNPKSRIVLHMHCEWLTQIDRDAARRSIADSNVVVACSEYITNLVRARFPEYAERINVLHNGADFETFSAPATEPGHAPSTTGPNVLFVGRVSPEKGIHDLLAAFEHVLDRVPEARLTIVGPEWTTPRDFLVDLSEEPEVKALARYYCDRSYVDQLRETMSPRLQARVEFTGQVPRQELSGYYQRASVLVNPSLSEAFGMSLIEAHASKRPVVATRVGGMQELIHDGVDGFLVPAAAPRELASALSKLLEDPELGRRLGEAGRASAERKFSWQQVSEDAFRHYTGS